MKVTINDCRGVTLVEKIGDHGLNNLYNRWVSDARGRIAATHISVYTAVVPSVMHTLEGDVLGEIRGRSGW